MTIRWRRAVRGWHSRRKTEVAGSQPRACWDDDPLAPRGARLADRHLTLTSLTSKTTAWFGPTGDCGVLP